MKTIYTLIAFSLSFFCFSNLDARHIIGGEMRYECLGNEQYKIVTRIYRDCGGQGADFDNPGIFSVYRFSNGNYEFEQTIFPLVENIALVELPTDTCVVIPPNLCVQQGDYIFELNLPLSPDSYVVAYQRCCRNGTLENIQQPEETGITLFIEILPLAQNVCNSSPVFSPLFSPVACVLDDIAITHTATDVDGDELSYQFCAPLDGGGLGGTTGGNPSTCDGVAPNPACPPPYAPINFLLPDFSPIAPLGGGIVLNSATGIITGVPENIGQYVYGICVEEYRNGELLSISRRDVQINITQCDGPDPMLSNSLVENDTIVVYTCGELQWQLLITNFMIDDVANFLWEVDTDSDGIFESSQAWSPLFIFPGEGRYSARLRINEGTSCEMIFPLLIDTHVDCGVVALDETDELFSVRLYPNPANDWLTLEWDTEDFSDELQIRIIDLQGRSKALSVSEMALGRQIAVADYPAGLYFLQYGTKGNWWGTQRFAIVR